MTILDLSNILKDMYSNASQGEQTTMIHLFGIKYAAEIRKNNFTPKEILRAAQMHESYQAEISKGIRLEKYVVTKE